jgi:hypothetical protein
MFIFFAEITMKNNLLFISFYLIVNIFVYVTYSNIKVNNNSNIEVLSEILLTVPYVIRDQKKNESYQIQIQKKIIPKVFSFKIKIPEVQKVNLIEESNINIKNFFSYGYNLKVNENLLKNSNCIFSPKILKYKDRNGSNIVQFGSEYKKLYMTNRLIKKNNCINKINKSSLVINFDFYNNKKDFIKINDHELIFEKFVDKSKDYTHLSVIILIVFILIFSLLFYYLDRYSKKIKN